MKILLEDKNKGYELVENDTGFYLNVLCGGIGMFIAKIILNPEEISRFHESGKAYIEDLASDIRRYPKQYESRMVR